SKSTPAARLGVSRATAEMPCKCAPSGSYGRGSRSHSIQIEIRKRVCVGRDRGHPSGFSLSYLLERAAHGSTSTPHGLNGLYEGVLGPVLEHQIRYQNS